MDDEVIIEQRPPHIAKLETGTFTVNIPDCCKLFAEADGDYRDIDCPHVTKEVRATKRNIGL